MEYRISRHVARVTEDILDVNTDGEFSLSDMQTVIGLAEQIIDQYGYYFTLTDVSHMGGLTPQARRLAATWSKTHPVAGIAMYGAKLTTRALLTLLMRAMNLVRRDPFPVTFTQNHREGLDWIATRREQARA